MIALIRLYLSRQASSLPRYLLEAAVTTLCGRIPTLVGVGLRAVVYRAILRFDGMAAIETGVRLRFADRIRLGGGSYLDQGVYLHACPGGIAIGPRTHVMHHAVLHVYNFRDLPQAGITIGADSLIGELCVLRGQGGITIGDRVYFAPLVQVLAVNHVYDDPTRPFTEQGITAEGIAIEDDVWVGAGAVITDGVRIGRGAVVAAGAVVTADVPAHSVVGGVPARVLRDIAADAARGAVRSGRPATVYHVNGVQDSVNGAGDCVNDADGHMTGGLAKIRPAEAREVGAREVGAKNFSPLRPGGNRTEPMIGANGSACAVTISDEEA